MGHIQTNLLFEQLNNSKEHVKNLKDKGEEVIANS